MDTGDSKTMTQLVNNNEVYNFRAEYFLTTKLRAARWNSTAKNVFFFPRDDLKIF
jgi:hypothetical protein